MINIRLTLNNRLREYGENIGYSIRPTERRKGYNKINLYLGLLICQQYGIKEVMLDADKENIASWKTMEALGGINVREFYDNKYTNSTVKDYIINVDEAINKYKEVYEKHISKYNIKKHK